jgi:UDP-N-acetylmuramate--alanine ligase
MKKELPYFFAGIGGIGMSALARHLKAQGCDVYGFDRTESRVSKKLIEEGIPITFSTSIDELPKTIKAASELEVIYTPALSADNPLLVHFRSMGFNLRKRSELLYEITSEYRCWAVSGTHGKTTTSALLTHLLKSIGQSPTAFLGGLLLDADSNYLEGNGEICVVEADEFDRSFLRLNPDSAIITSIEPDHLDIYGNANTYQEAFYEFRKLVTGACLVHLSTGLKGITYGWQNADHSIIDFQIVDGAYHFTWKGPNFKQEVVMNYPGLHNVENALAAMALCAENGFSPPDLADALKSFPGVWRRFERKAQTDRRIYYDDYAHHPGELKALISSLKDLHPNKKLCMIFQPHLFSRTRDFIDEFAKELSEVDTLLLLPIYPARELPIAGVTSEALLQLCTNANKKLIQKEDLLSTLSQIHDEIIVTAGAGDIDRFVEPIAEFLGR